jgi:DNA topoisomerase-2
MKFEEFINNDFINYPVYDNTRKIASYIDGLKNTSRKVLYTVLEKNITKPTIVSRLSATVAEFTNYVHGQVSIEGVIVNMAQDFVGANNLPYLVPEGHFGDRLSPEPAASRYINTYLQPYIRDIYKKEDDSILEEQFFEGQKIEYKYYVPIIPMLLVNGSEGVSTGFAQKILPRNIKDLINYIKGKKTKLKPYFRGFKGTIKEYENGWEIFGKFERIGRTRLTIFELPIGYDLKSYLKVLNDLEEKKIIKSYKDKSQNGEFLFELNVSSEFNKLDDKEIIKKLKLSKKVVENFTCIDENNKIIEFNNVFELFDKFIEIRLQFYEKRKNYLLKKYQEEISFLLDKAKFIKSIIDNKLIINKKSKKDILEQCKNLNIKFGEDHLRMNLYNLTEEKINELKSQIKSLQEKIDTLSKKSPKEIWIEELSQLKLP